MTRTTRWFPDEEYERRVVALRAAMAEQDYDGCLVASPENIYYLTGLHHQGYFAYQLLIVGMEGEPILITRAMERAIIRDQVPQVRHVGYSDGVAPLPAPAEPTDDLVLGEPTDEGTVFGLEPWSTSLGVQTAGSSPGPPSVRAAVRATCEAIEEAGLAEGRLAFEEGSAFLPYRIARGIVDGLPRASWHDAQGLVDDLRMVQSPLELKCTRQAATVSDAMMLAGIAAAGAGVPKRDVVAAVYDAMFRRGGTYPGFVPLVRSTRTLEHEHGTWDDGRLRSRDILFLELAGCVRRYHAPMGRLVFIGGAPARTRKIHDVCVAATERAAETIAPGVLAGDVYRAWQEVVDGAGLSGYRRHHCGYSVGIGFPPSWSGSGVPQGLRADSKLVLREGMVFHLMSWLLRTGRGDSFLSDTIVVTGKGAQLLTRTPRDVFVRR